MFYVEARSMELGERLKGLRKQKRLTQVAVQMETGIEQTLLSKYERGERIPPTETLLTLAQFYGTSMDYLMGLTDEIRPYPRRGRGA